MITILNTSNSKTREQALNVIIKQMTDSLLYIPLAYRLDESGCSCCRSEYFDLICKVGNEYKILCYHGYIKHSNDCAIVRCSCYQPFTWKNINPKQQKYEDLDLSSFETFTSVNNDTWYYDFKYFFEQQQENNAIYKYNEDENKDTNIYEKNYAFYFS
jgi:hypothetical protein